METSLKTGFAQIFSCCPKNLSYPNFGGAAAPLAPPARTPMGFIAFLVKARASHRYCEVKGSNPVEVLNFFQASYAIAQIAFKTARIILSLPSL